MGSVLDSKMTSEKPLAVVNPMPAKNEEEEEKVEREEQPKIEAPIQKANVSLHVFHYRQQIVHKSSHVVKWASAKLLLTEELLKQKQQQLQSTPAVLFDEFEETDAEWAERQLALLTDDEDSDSDSEEENQPPIGMELEELNHLLDYRHELRAKLLHVAQEKLRKREKTKVKRLQRRTLISSKKPSNKDKYRY